MSYLTEGIDDYMNVDCKCLKKYGIDYIKEKYLEVQSRDESYAYILMNIKNFRYYNTKYGNAGGDEILALVFQKIKSTLKDKEYIAHIYADNFVFLIRYNDVHTLVYERITQLIDIIYRIEDVRIFRNAFYSFGIYILKDRNVEFMDAFNYANLCRKECDTLTNRSSCLEIYDVSFYKRYMDHLELEINTADAYKNYEFISYLQPKVDLNNEKVIGAEALLRWFDSNGNMIPLDQYLPILNENGYIKLVDLDIFDEMCKYLEERIQHKQSVVPISFNISNSYFYNPDIIEDYIGVFEKYDLPKNLIQIEFMESISLDNSDRMQTIISGFKEYGFTCVLDDFGNGYSSFNVLLNAPLDIVKMDRQFFLKNLNGDNELVIKTVIDLIHSLHMKVVAEGVEKKAHIDFLKICGCDFVQGYYYYKPMSLDNFSVLLDSSNT